MAATRGEGPNALPQGAATQVNANTPPPQPGPSMDPQQPADIPVDYVTGPQKVDNQDLRDTENNQLLTAPADPGFKPSPQSMSPARVPRSVARSLPLLMAASKDPEAPRSVRAIYRAMVAKLEEEQGEPNV